MNRLMMMIVALVIAGSSFAQKKPKVGQAETALLDGDYQTALEITGLGIEHEKTKEDPKMWFVRALAFAALDTINTNEEGNLDKAMAAFDMAKKLKKGGSELYVGSLTNMVMQSFALSSMWGYYINKGVHYFRVEDAKSAMINFEKSTIVQPDSVDGYYYAGLAAISIENWDRALDNFRKYADKGGKEIDAYDNALYILTAEKKDNEAALAFLEETKEKFPNESKILDWEFRIMYALNRLDEAITKLEEAVTRDPNNADLHFNLGVIKDNMEKSDEAMVHYENAIKVDKTHFNSYYNLGVIYRTQIVELQSQLGSLGMSAADNKKYDEITKEIKAICKTALPYWERCYELDNTNGATVETLQYLYVQLGEMDKAEKIKARAEELGLGDN